jgi:hypothetical protein
MQAKYNTWLMCNDDGDSILLEQSPIGWDAVKFNLIRDLTYLGIMKSITVEYEFVGDGFRFLQSKRLKYGIDADILLRQYINNPNQWLFDGKVNQENYNEDRKARKYKVDIVQSSFVQNFQNREDIVVNVLNNISLDRQGITPAALTNCLFRGKQIEFYSKFEGSSQTEPDIYHHVLPFQLVVNGNPGVKDVNNILPDTWTPDTLDIETCANNPLILFDNSFYSNVLTETQTINLEWDFSFSAVAIGPGFPPSDDEYFFLVYRLLKVNSDNSVDEQLFYTSIVINGGSVSLEYNDEYSITLDPGQYLIWLCERWSRPSPISLPLDLVAMEEFIRTEITYTNMLMIIDQHSIVSDSIHPVILPHELFSNLVAQINGGSLYSEVFGRTELGYYADGEFAYLGITKGELLRGIDPSEVQIPTSMRDAYKSYSSVICLGALITERQIRIDPLEILFNSNITTYLGEVNDLQISPAKEFLFNSVKAGYPKNEYEQENGRDEFNTQYQYTNSFKSVKKELDLMSVYNGDGYGIEFARRASVITTGTADSRYDDIIFFVDMILDGDTLMTRRLEGILEVSGIFSPETALNLRIAVGQNMLRQKKYLNIPLHKKDKLYFFQSKDKNASLHLVTALGTTDDGEDLDTGDIALFLPDQRGFNVPMTIERLFAILANPLGLIQYRYKREDFFDYLMEVDSETDKGKGQWRTLGTRDTPVEIVDDAQEGNILMHDDGLTDYVAHEDAEDDLVLYE